MVKTRSLYLTWPWIRTGSWQTDRQTLQDRDSGDSVSRNARDDY